MNTIDEQLWNYIDGTSSPEAVIAIEQMLHENPDIKKLYDEYISIHQHLKSVELEEPSLRFTQNIMDLVAFEPAPKIVKTKVDTRIIKGIGGFFLISILGLLVYTLSQIQWSHPAGSTFSFQMPQVNWSNILNRNLLAFLIIDEVAALFLIDKLMRKTIHKNGSSL
ncbi:MAG: hypothetical protein H0W62_08760 [Chitinophagales bacterium]|nr:hypothetical protein [Chitinophagales bacterium]